METKVLLQKQENITSELGFKLKKQEEIIRHQKEGNNRKICTQ